MEKRIRNNEEGFVLVVALITLVLLTVFGIMATRNTSIELNIAGNEKVAKQTFYQADGATEAGVELVTENISCPIGFQSAPPTFGSNDPSKFFSLRGVDVFDASFAYAETRNDVAHSAAVGAAVDLNEVPSADARSLRIPGNLANRDAVPVTNIAAWGLTVEDEGTEKPMGAGYDNPAGLGYSIAYQIHAQHLGLVNSQSIVRLDWRHKIDSNVQCIY